jgi:hypothetical protein
VRLYEMTFADGVWTLERTKADFSTLDFSQRLGGRAHRRRRTIQGRWLDRNADGGWSDDFALTYTRIA